MMEVEEKHVCKICDGVENNDITNDWVLSGCAYVTKELRV